MSTLEWKGVVQDQMGVLYRSHHCNVDGLLTSITFNDKSAETTNKAC